MKRLGGPHVLSLMAGLCALAGCAEDDEIIHVSALERGQALFRDRSDKAFERACADCHSTEREPDALRVWPGATLAGATRRESFWGGQQNDLLGAVNDCRTLFQGLRSELLPDSADAAALYAFLDSLDGDSAPWPFTIERAVIDLAPGDAESGKGVFDAACKSCHGAIASGRGAVRGVPLLPAAPLREHSEYSASEQRLIFVEKVRHGGFLGYGGYMPPFSLEVLPDTELADALSALGLDP